LNKRLYILEDIDSDDLKDIVVERGDENNDENDSNFEKLNKEDSNFDYGGMFNLFKPGFKFTYSKLTLANLLEILDGVMEMDGRLLIITTNYPEKLDKALIRPGRVDMKVKFSLCTRETIMAMYEHFFGQEIPKDFEIEKLPEGKWSPAEVTQVLINHMKRPEESLEVLATAHSLANLHLLKEEEGKEK